MAQAGIIEVRPPSLAEMLNKSTSVEHIAFSPACANEMLGVVKIKMDILQLLKDAMQERFKADSVVKRLEKIIEKVAEEKTFEKYKDEKIIRNGMHFELIGVKASFSCWNIEIKGVDIKLAFVTSSKLPKAKRDKVEEVKSKYLEKKYLEWNNFKVALWEELRYEVELENVLSGEINLVVS